jgi:hypothetical protein
MGGGIFCAKTVENVRAKIDIITAIDFIVIFLKFPTDRNNPTDGISKDNFQAPSSFGI